MAVLGADYQDNLGGIIRLDLAFVEDIVSDSLDSFEATEVTSVLFLSETSGLSQTQKNDKNGNYWQAKIPFIIPKIREFLISWVSENNLRWMVAIMQDANGLVRKVGSIAKPLQIIADEKTGEPYSARSEYQFELSGKLLKPAPKMINYTFPILNPDETFANMIPQSYNLILEAGIEQTISHNQNTEKFVPAFFSSAGILENISIRSNGVNALKVLSSVDKTGVLNVIFIKLV